MKNLPAIIETKTVIEHSAQVLVFTKYNMFVTGFYFHTLGEWNIDGHFRNHDYVLEWWPLPEIGTGNK